MSKAAKPALKERADMLGQIYVGLEMGRNLNAHLRKPPNGWLRGIRKFYKVKLTEAAKLRNVTTQVQAAAERAEAEERITLRTLRAVADSMNLDLVYCFAPRDDSPEVIFEKRVRELMNGVPLEVARSIDITGYADVVCENSLYLQAKAGNSQAEADRRPKAPRSSKSKERLSPNGGTVRRTAKAGLRRDA